MISTIRKCLINPRMIISILLRKGLFSSINDNRYLSILYYAQMGKKLNIQNPISFNEKIQWLKIHDRNPNYKDWVDKKEAKEKAARLIGKEHIIPLLGAWENPEDIQFEKLPNKCVLKCNHDQGSFRIIDKSQSQDWNELKRYFKKRLKRNPYHITREWPYKDIKPCVICEEYLQDEIIDYKFFCFNGEPRFINIGTKEGPNYETHVTFLNLNWEQMPFQRTDYKQVSNLPSKPEELKEMLGIVKKLATGTRFVRIDLFLVKHRIYFSEFTLYPTSGLIKFDPPEYDNILGGWIEL